MGYERLQALCCQCGQVRSMSSVLSAVGLGQSVGEPHVSEWLDEAPNHPTAWNRCCVIRKCSNCKCLTMHAYLRPNNQYKDTLEWDHRVVCQGWMDPTEFGQKYPRRSCSFCGAGVEAWAGNNPETVLEIRKWRTGRAY